MSRRIGQKKCVGNITDYICQNVTTDVWPTDNRKNDKSNGNMVSDVRQLLKYMFISNENKETKKEQRSLPTTTTVTNISDE